MSRTSFKTHCIEFYADHIQRPSPDVYRLFNENGLLAMLDDDYEDLHGMSTEYLMHFFDEYLEDIPDMRNMKDNMGHCLIRATLMPEIIRLIALNYNVSENKVLEMFYQSATAASLYDNETGLYGQSALFILSEFTEELQQKKR